MSVINTNIKSLYTQAALKTSGRELSVAMQQLSTGKRINSSKDDAAGLAIAARMTQHIRSLDQAIRNAGDAVTLIQTAEGATNSISDMLTRMRELSIQASNDTYSPEQRSYLDQEFQQLKQEIARVANTTEWNGFPVLNGSAGQQVGERPVYKTISQGSFDQVFVNPTTYRHVAGADSGEIQTITFTGPATAAGTVTVAGQPVDIANGDTAAAIAEKVRAALAQTAGFNSQSGRTLSVSGGVLKVNFGQAEGNVSTLTATASAAGVTSTVATTGQSIASAAESYSGQFLRSGTLTISKAASNNTAITATFAGNDGNSISLTGTLDASNGKVSFDPATGDNAKLINQTLSYTLKDDSSNPVALTNRAVDVVVVVKGSVPPLESGDITINGIAIGASQAGDDTVSPPNNALGSAIAKAATINRYTDLTGVHAVVNANTLHGAAQTGSEVVNGRVTINGIQSGMITSVLNNNRESRAAVIHAINQISDRTGVVAEDTGSDAQGVRLVAQDGRNIEVTFDSDVTDTVFSQRTGLRQGVQAGTYSLESKVDAPIVIGTAENGDPAHAGLSTGSFTQNVSAYASSARALVSGTDTPAALSNGDLVINGFAIRGATDADDTLTDPAALGIQSNQRAASAIAMANAINASSAQTGVTATPNPVITAGTVTRVDSTRSDGAYSLWLNGIEVQVNFSKDQTVDERAAAVAQAINAKAGAHGVNASVNDSHALTLSTPDGRNLSVWFDDTSLKASEFGLGNASGGMAAGVSAKSTASTLKDASTLYGGVTLKSDKPMDIRPGTNGYGTQSHFSQLGLREGVFGGEVDQAVSKMNPPRVGRISFQVGATAGQVIHIDLADFGPKGTITGAITGDVDATTPAVHIKTGADAQAVLSKLDDALDKVSATRARMGAVMNRLEHVIDNLTNVSTNTQASRSQIEDADYAAASTELARTQIMQQAATAVLAQANQSQQTVLKLLG